MHRRRRLDDLEVASMETVSGFFWPRMPGKRLKPGYWPELEKLPADMEVGRMFARKSTLRRLTSSCLPLERGLSDAPGGGRKDLGERGGAADQRYPAEVSRRTFDSLARRLEAKV